MQTQTSIDTLTHVHALTNTLYTVTIFIVQTAMPHRMYVWVCAMYAERACVCNVYASVHVYVCACVCM